MIHSARPRISPVVSIVFTWNLFVLLDFEKWRTDSMCENNDHYQPWLWGGRVDQLEQVAAQEYKWSGIILHFVKISPLYGRSPQTKCCLWIVHIKVLQLFSEKVDKFKVPVIAN